MKSTAYGIQEFEISVTDLRKLLKPTIAKVNSDKATRVVVKNHDKRVAWIVRCGDISAMAYHNTKPIATVIQAWYFDPDDILRSRWRTATNVDGAYRWVSDDEIATFKLWRVDPGEPSRKIRHDNLVIRTPKPIAPSIHCKTKRCRNTINLPDDATSSVDNLVEWLRFNNWTPDVIDGKFYGAVCPKHGGH